jgi:hypothetical protein
MSVWGISVRNRENYTGKIIPDMDMTAKLNSEEAKLNSDDEFGIE